MRTNKHGQMRTMFVPAAFKNLLMTDLRSGLNVGNIVTLCAQHGIRVTKEGKLLRLSAPRDRLQIILETVHYASVPYSVGDKAPTEKGNSKK
jgi:hypothetical protein